VTPARPYGKRAEVSAFGESLSKVTTGPKWPVCE
jgi:hypothetical protein